MRLLAAASLVCASTAAWAQTYPTKLVRVVVPYAAGGPTDIVARLISQGMSDAWKQPVIVENRPGAGGMIGTEYVAKASADGYTLLISGSGPVVVNQSLFKKMSYDTVKDLAPITELVSAPTVLSVPPSLGVNSVSELIALAKAKPGELNYASNGIGSTTHLATELFKLMTGTKLVHVPYKGLSPALTDLLSGQMQLMFSSAVAMLPQVKAGKLRAIAMTGAKRSASIPDIPTVAESGVRNFEAGSWYGIVAPAGTARPIVDLLNREIVAATKSQDILDRLTLEAVTPVGNTPEEFAAYIRVEHARVAKVVKASDAKFD